MPRRANNKNKILTIAILSLITGTLNAIAIVISFYPASIARVFRYIASGCFGLSAFNDDHMVLLGLLFHYVISIIFSLAFWAIYPKFKNGLKNKYFIGVIFGLITWVVMNFAVLPLTNIPKPPEHTSINMLTAIEGIAALIICVGLPAALISDRYYVGKAKRAARRRVRNNYS